MINIVPNKLKKNIKGITPNKFTNKRIYHAIVTVLMIFITLIELFPIYLIVVNSVKTLGNFVDDPLGLPQVFALKINYSYVIEKMEYFLSLKNTVIILLPALLSIIICGAMAGFVISRRRSKLNNTIYTIFVLGIALPTFTMLYPQLRLLTNLKIRNNILGLVLVYTANGIPMSLFLYTGFFGSVPKELEEASMLDGCGLIRCFFQIFFPLAAATTATLVMLQSIGIWNDVQLPRLVFVNKSSMQTLMPMLNAFYGRQVGQGTR
ncbi:MAG: carbohydrate ABC transporter permease, partial [Clostridia bacterium]|nr:carbohydrate ABC transporter permease [Clostridia bacterium]